MVSKHASNASLAPHFDTPGQQFESAKLGMWLFLATEVLFFGGLFCAYVVFRSVHPEVFEYGAQFLDKRLGALNTVVLLVSSLTMAVAVTMIRQGKRRETFALLAGTFVCAAMFMGIKYIEYSHKFHEHLVWGTEFYEPPQWVQDEVAADMSSAEGTGERVPSVEQGSAHWQAVCRSCHGAQGEGVVGQGKDVRGFSARNADGALAAFIIAGRSKSDPDNTTGILMPPRGGNPLLGDDDVRDIVAYMRTLPAASESSSESAAMSEVPSAEATDVWLPRSVIPEPHLPPPGLDPKFFQEFDGPLPHHTVDPDRPQNAHLFFAVYFCLTGLHGIHVLAGMVMIAWLMFGTSRGKYGAECFTQIDLGALYWHIVDVIWIFLFPLLYLVG